MSASFTHPIVVRPVEDITFTCKDFFEYAKAMQLPDPTRIEMSEEVNEYLTRAVNNGFSPFALLRLGESSTGHATSKVNYQYDENGKEYISFPDIHTMSLRFHKFINVKENIRIAELRKNYPIATDFEELAFYLSICGWVGCTSTTVEKEFVRAQNEQLHTMYGKSNSGQVAYTFLKSDRTLFTDGHPVEAMKRYIGNRIKVGLV